MPFLNYTPLILLLKVILAGHTVAMVTHCDAKMITTCSPMIGQLVDTMIVRHQVLKSRYNDPSKYKRWKLLKNYVTVRASQKS